MGDQTLQDDIRACFAEAFETQDHDGTLPDLRDDSVLLETGLDSLGFAVLVTLLDDKLGYDPFTLSHDAYYPVTFKEFVDFYRANQPTAQAG